MRQRVRPLLLFKKRSAFYQRVRPNLYAMNNRLMDETLFGGVRPIRGWTGLENCAPAVVDLGELATYMESQGWNVDTGASALTVEGQEFLTAFLMGCDFHMITPGALRHDLCVGMQAQGFCSEGCM